MGKELSGEFGWIERIRGQFASLVPPGAEGIGDDGAVIPVGNGESLVVTTDMLTEGAHFLPEHISPEDLGYKSLAVNLSDVAAMGAVPVGSFLSVGLPASVDDAWKAAFLEGYHALSEEFQIPLLGGDTTRADKIVVNVTAIGKAPDDRIKRRSGARPGDMVCVTGPLGDSAAGLQLLLKGGGDSPEEQALIAAHHRPRPYVREGEWLGGRPEVRAMMDVSDGIASDLVHILEKSEVGAAVDLDRLPLSAALKNVTAKHGWGAEKLAVSGGEDYVLLLAIERDKFNDLHQNYKEYFGRELTAIGEIVAGEPAIRWQRGGENVEADYKGFSHF